MYISLSIYTYCCISAVDECSAVDLGASTSPAPLILYNGQCFISDGFGSKMTSKVMGERSDRASIYQSILGRAPRHQCSSCRAPIDREREVIWIGQKYIEALRVDTNMSKYFGYIRGHIYMLNTIYVHVYKFLSMLLLSYLTRLMVATRCRRRR